VTAEDRQVATAEARGGTVALGDVPAGGAAIRGVTEYGERW
jgi:hypothetical protein